MRILLVSLAYFISASLTITYSRFEGGLAFIWLSAGILTGVMIVSDRRRWPGYVWGCAAASFVATWVFGLGLLAAGPLVIVNMAEAVIAAALTRRWSENSLHLQTPRSIGVLLLNAGVIAPSLTGLAGAAVASSVVDVPFWANWFAWTTGHALGAIIVTPLVILSLGGSVLSSIAEAPRRRLLEAAGITLLVVGATSIAFGQSKLPLLFLPLLPMIIAVFRFDRLGAVISISLVATMGILCTLNGSGPISSIENVALRSGLLQLYLATTVLIVLPAAGDLKRHKRTIQDLEQQAALQRIILDRTGDIIMSVGLDGKIGFVSSSSNDILGVHPDRLVGSMAGAFVHEEDSPAFQRAHESAIQAPETTSAVEFRIVHEGREIGWFEAHARATTDAHANPTGVVSVIRDITQRKLSEQSLISAAFTDPLTLLANRRAFDEALMKLLARDAISSGMALALFDLDNFKAVNDRFGHAAGDDVLKAFAGILRGYARGNNLPARIGGEEFAVLFQESDIATVHFICEKIRSGLEKASIRAGGNTLDMTVSIGVAHLSYNMSPQTLFSSADSALYRAKAAGRNKMMMAA